MGYATLGFSGGPAIRFRIDPTSIDWTFQVIAVSANTIGGRVVQIIGAEISDVAVSGLYGQDHSTPDGESWRLAQRFANNVRALMEYQSRDARDFGRMHPPATFTYPPLNIKLRVYIKAFADPDGGAVAMRTGKFSHGYTLTLFVVQDGSDVLTRAGSKNGALQVAKAKAINEYIARISDGIGWRPTKYNGNFGDYYGGQGLGDYGDEGGDDGSGATATTTTTTYPGTSKPTAPLPGETS